MPAIEDTRAAGAPGRFLFAVIAVIAAVVGLLYALSGVQSTFRPPQREGSPALVDAGGEPVLWLLTKREEWRQVAVGGVGSGDFTGRTFYHFDLIAHDPHSTRVLWQKRLLTLDQNAGGHGAQARILGQQGDRVWLFVHDAPLAVSSRDGHVLADRTLLEQRNPALRGLVPGDLDFYTWWDGLVITAADARYYRIGKDLDAQEFTPPEGESFGRANFLSTRWNGGYQTKDFLVRAGTVGERLIGLHTAREAEDAAHDEWGDKLKDPAEAWDEGKLARRAPWVARIETRQPWPDRPAYQYIAALDRLDGAPEFLQGGMLKRAGVRAPLVLDDPAGALVIHRTRVDDAGRLLITRVDADFRVRWSTELPLVELQNRWELGGELLLYGTDRVYGPAPSEVSEYLIALRLQDGHIEVRNVQADAGPTGAG